MRWLALAIVIASSCHDSSMPMDRVRGLPIGVSIRCGEFDGATAMCVGSDHKSYGCVSDSSGCELNPSRYDCTETQVFNHHTTDTTVYYNTPIYTQP